MTVIETINEVQGFDPAPFAVEYTDLNSNETRKRLPVMIQMAWFRLKYPEGKIAVQVTPSKDCFVATREFIRITKILLNAILLKQPLQEGIALINLLCRRVNGHRQPQSALRFERRIWAPVFYGR